MEGGLSEEVKQRRRYGLDHLRAATAQGMRLAKYACVSMATHCVTGGRC